MSGAACGRARRGTAVAWTSGTVTRNDARTRARTRQPARLLLLLLHPSYSHEAQRPRTTTTATTTNAAATTTTITTTYTACFSAAIATIAINTHQEVKVFHDEFVVHPLQQLAERRLGDGRRQAAVDVVVEHLRKVVQLRVPIVLRPSWLVLQRPCRVHGGAW